MARSGKRPALLARLLRSLLPRSAAARRALPVLSQEVHRELARANADLEDAFHTLGNQFLPLAERLGGLVSDSEQLHALAVGQREGQTLFQEAVHCLHPPFEYIGYCGEQDARLLDLLGQCEGHTLEMLNCHRLLHDTLTPLTYIEILFKIEAASLDPTHRETFLTVVAEIGRLRGLVDETFRGNSALLVSTHDTMVRVRRKLETDLQNHREVVAQKRSQIEAAIESMDQQLLRHRHDEVPLQHVSTALKAHINEMVQCVQHQDIVKQKCDHVATALAGWARQSPPSAQLVELQVKQLEAVDQELQEAAGRAEASITGMLARANEVDATCAALVQTEGSTVSADGMVQLLLDALAGVEDVIRTTVGLARDTLEATQPAGTIAGKFSTALEELSINMRLIALNAQVRSLQLQSDTGLEVLAARTAAISGELADTSAKVAVALNRLQQTTGEMFGLLNTFVDRGNQQQAAMAGEGRATEGRLHELRDRTLRLFSDLSTAVNTVRDAANGAQATVDRLPAARSLIQQCAAGLRAYAQAFGLNSTGPLEGRHAAELAQHAQHYTTARERHIHASLTKSGLASPPSVGATEPELFEDFSSPPPAAPRAGSMFASSSAPTPRPPEPPPPPADLGQNVDLF